MSRRRSSASKLDLQRRQSRCFQPKYCWSSHRWPSCHPSFCSFGPSQPSSKHGSRFESAPRPNQQHQHVDCCSAAEDTGFWKFCQPDAGSCGSAECWSVDAFTQSASDQPDAVAATDAANGELVGPAVKNLFLFISTDFACTVPVELCS